MSTQPQVSTNNSAQGVVLAPASASAHPFPEFPTEAYLGVLADFAELWSHYYETPKEFLYFAAILYVGIALCKRVRADFGSLETQPRLLGLKIGPVGTSKKSTADTLAGKFVGKALEAAQQEDVFDVGPPAISAQPVFVLHGAGSAEGLLTALQKNKRVLLSYDEFERFSKKAGVDGSVLGTIVNEMFDKADYANAVKGNVQSISGAYLGFSANIPLEQFESASGVGKMQDLGLWSRLCFVVGDRRHRFLRVSDPPAELIQTLNSQLVDYFKALPKAETALKLTSEAHALWDGYEEIIGNGPDATRLDTIGMRVMAILAFTSGRNEIDAQVVNATLAFLKYQKTVRELYKPSHAETIEAKAEAAIMRCVKRAHASGKYPITERHIRRNTSIEKTYGIDTLREALERLCKAQYLLKTSVSPVTFELGPEAES